MRMGTRLIWNQNQRRIKRNQFYHNSLTNFISLLNIKKKKTQITVSYESIHRLVKSHTLTFLHSTPDVTYFESVSGTYQSSNTLEVLIRGLTSYRQVVGFPSTTRRWRNPVKQATLKNASAVLHGRNEQVFHFNVWYWSWHYTRMKPDFLDYFIVLDHFTFHCLWAIKRNGITLTFYLLYIIIFSIS